MCDAWEDTKAEANLLTKVKRMVPKTEKECLGLHWNLRDKTLMASSKAIDAIHDAMRFLEVATFREVFMIFGICNYARYMMSLPSFRYQHFMLWFRRAGTLLANNEQAWDQPARLPRSAARSIRRLARDIGKPRRVTNPHAMHDACLYSDASESGGGFIICDPATVSHGWKWTAQQQEQFPHIHQKEALALVSAVKAALEMLPNRSKIRALVDNQVLDWNWTGQKAADPIMASILDGLQRVLDQRECTLDTQWIPTDTNIADPLSRLFERNETQIQ